MKLIVNPGFEKPKLLKPAVYVETGGTREIEFSEYATPYVSPLDSAKLKYLPSLQKTYLEGSWLSHVPGQTLVTVSDLSNMFYALVEATRHYVSVEQGVEIKEFEGAASKAIAATIDIIKPHLAGNIVGYFNRDLLVRAVFLRVCGDDTSVVIWNQFLSTLTFNGPYSKGINPAYYQGGSTAASKIARTIAGVQPMPDIDLSEVVTQMKSEEKAFVAPVGLKSMAKEFMSVQPMTKDGAVPTKMKFSTPKNKSIITLKDIYCAGKWKGHEPGQKLLTVVDFVNMFEFLTRATLYYAAKVQGVVINEFKDAVTKAVAKTVEACIEPYAVTGNIIGHFDRSALVDAVVLRACGNDAWAVAWKEFMYGLTSTKTHPNNLLVKCDEANNLPEDVEQGKLNVDVVVPAHTVDHVDLDFVLLPNGKKVEVGSDNQPVPCDPPKPKPFVARKVPIMEPDTEKMVAAPGPGWWVGDDYCWHPPVEKKVEGKFEKASHHPEVKYSSDLWNMVTALDHPSMMVDELKQAAMTQMPEEQAGQLAQDLVDHGWPKIPSGFVHAPYQPVYTTPGLSIGGHGKIGPGGKIEDHKVDGVWPVTVLDPAAITKSAPCAPTSIDDVASGFEPGNVWYDSSSGKLYLCTDNTVGVAVWKETASVTPSPEGPKIIVSGKPEHITNLEQQEIEDMKKKLLAGPTGVTYTDHSDDSLKTHWSPEAEKDLVQAMSDNIKMDLQREMEKGIVAGIKTADVVVTELGHPNKNGNVYGKSVLASSLSDVLAMQKVFDQSIMVPSHLLHGQVQNTK